MNDTKRGRKDALMTALAYGAFAAILVPLLAVVARVAKEARIDGPTLSISLHAASGSLAIVLVAALVAVPLGVLGGVFVVEMASPLVARIVRFGNDVLAGIPPIVLGFFVYATVVIPMGGFSLFAGALGLALVMLPAVTRATEEMLMLVPEDLRDAGLGLGLPRRRVIFFVLLRSALPGLANVILFSIARAFGEAAPLLFTSASSRHTSSSLLSPASSLPVEIYTEVPGADPGSRHVAFTMTLVLLALVAATTTLGRTLERRLR